jgi:hypothetical protein
VCVNHFLFQKQERCTAGPGQGVFLDVTPSENLDYGRIYPNAGVTGSTTVYGVIYYKDPPPPPPPLSWHCCDNLGGNVVGDPEKTVDVVARDSANSVSHWKWNGTTWLSDNLGGNITSDPDMSSWGSQRMDVFARGIDNALWHRYWNNGFWDPGRTWAAAWHQAPARCRGVATASTWLPAPATIRHPLVVERHGLVERQPRRQHRWRSGNLLLELWAT